MEKVIKNCLASLTVMSLVSCSWPQSPPGESLETNPDSNEVIRLKNSGLIPQEARRVFIADVGKGKKGASFSVKIKFPESPPAFRTTANSNGSFAKTFADVQTYIVYLVQNASLSSYPPGGDPLGADFVSGPFTVTNAGGQLVTILITNVDSSLTSTSSNAYYVAVLAKDNQNNDLIKPNNGSSTAWTGTTAATPAVAVSTGAGVTVDASLQLSSVAGLSVTPNLLDISGATLRTDLIPNSGNALIPTISAASFDGELRVNTTTINSQLNSSAAMDSNGDFVIAWESNLQDGSNYGIYAQRFNATGLPQGGEFGVNTTTLNSQLNSSAAMDSNGDFVIVWDGNGPGDSTGVFAQRYNSDGSKPATNGSELRVNTTTLNSQSSPSAAMDSTGDFVIAWTGNGTGDTYGIFAQRYNSAGAVQGGEFRVNTTTLNSQLHSSSAMDSNGDFVIAWSGNGPGDIDGIFAQRYNSAGAVQGGEFRVNTTTLNSQSSPSAAMDSTGDFVISWQSYDGNSFGIYAQRYNSAGAVQGGEFRVNSTTSGAQSDSSSAMDSNGDFVIAWQSSFQDGDVLGIFAQRYSAAGSIQGGEFRVNTYTTGAQINPSAAMDSSGNFVVSWQSYFQDGSNFGIYSQRYNSAGIPK
jgi:hypothetical protein